MTDGFGRDGNGLGGSVGETMERVRVIDPDAPVSGHRVPPAAAGVASLAPEDDWATAKARIFPSLRPAGTLGVTAEELASILASPAAASHTQPLIRPGPAGLPVAYLLAAAGFDVVVNGDHLVGWAVDGAAVHEAAMANLAAWSASAPWTDETDGARRLLSSDTGEGWDASRILLAEVRRELADELGHAGRVLVGLPERHLLLAASLHADDAEFAALFSDFVVEHCAGSDEPIDRRIFELVGGELVEFAPA